MTQAAKRMDAPILAAVDFSSFSERALVWAAQAAKAFDAPLVALHVVHDPESEPGYYRRSAEREPVLERIEKAASDRMAEFLDRTRKLHPELPADLEHRLVVGIPATRILEVAENIDARLIVMGSQGRTGLPHLLLGSKAERVAQLSPIPVTIVKGGD